MNPPHQEAAIGKVLALSLSKPHGFVRTVNWNLTEHAHRFFFSWIHLEQEISGLEEVRRGKENRILERKQGQDFRMREPKAKQSLWCNLHQ